MIRRASSSWPGWRAGSARASRGGTSRAAPCWCESIGASGTPSPWWRPASSGGRRPMRASPPSRAPSPAPPGTGRASSACGPRPIRRAASRPSGGAAMTICRCAVYTRKSTEHNLDLDFNSLDAQREACEAYIKSQAHEGWRLIPARYDDGGLSGASLDRSALQALLADIGAGRIDIVVVYKVDRLTRSLADFAKLVELFDAHAVSFVSITQSFNTTSSMGRLTLNVLLSFAQFEREVMRASHFLSANSP